MNKLNVGCGTDIKKGYVNLDSHNNNGVDIVYDLNKILTGDKLPFKDNSFDIVYCSHVLEDFLTPEVILDELVRVTKGKLIIIVPLDTTKGLTNLNHKYDFTAFNLLGYANYNTHYAKNNNVSVVYSRYVNTCSKGIYPKVCELVRNFLGYKIVEYTFIKYLFPISEFEIHYKKESE